MAGVTESESRKASPEARCLESPREAARARLCGGGAGFPRALLVDRRQTGLVDFGPEFWRPDVCKASLAYFRPKNKVHVMV